MTTHYKDIDDVVRLDQITCAECREKVGIELLGGEDMTCDRIECGNPKTLELHACPFDADINNDSTPKCRCCSECAHECAMDI
jgi:hypothetical protein